MKRKPRMVYWIGYAHGFERMRHLTHRRGVDYNVRSYAESYRRGYAAGANDRRISRPADTYVKAIWPRLPGID